MNGTVSPIFCFLSRSALFVLVSTLFNIVNRGRGENNIDIDGWYNKSVSSLSMGGAKRYFEIDILTYIGLQIVIT
jgi:hypothetical protein